jgi:CDP-diglyceride synthetase
MVKRKNKTVLGVIGVILTLFGIIFTIPILLTKEYFFALPITALAVILGVILIALSFND